MSSNDSQKNDKSKLQPDPEQEDHIDWSKVAEECRSEMEILALRVRDLVISQPPIKLLGYVAGMFILLSLRERDKKTGVYTPERGKADDFQFPFEYLHAVWSSSALLGSEDDVLDEKKAEEFIDATNKIREVMFSYCMAAAMSILSPGHPKYLVDIQYQANLSWAIIRGHRYQVLEQEFFEFVLSPHADALLAAYGVSAVEIAAGIQRIADAMRTGVSDAVDRIRARMEQAYKMTEELGKDMEGTIKLMESEDPDFRKSISNDMKDMFFGGTRNLSRHSKLPALLLEDLSYVPGENSEFFAPGEFCGTPMRTLPARVKPGVKLGDEYFATDGQFVRDSAYRAIQRGVWARLPYRNEWLKRQAALVEMALPTILSRQFSTARIFNGVFYRDIANGAWVESDTILVMDDVLLVLEAKAGNFPMHSPVTNFATHMRAINELVVRAYNQCKRFLDYAASSEEVSIFNLIGGDYVEIGKITYKNFRVILPIGLTIESFTPFSAMAKELPDVNPIHGKFPFISMSVDDLFVLNRFLPTSGSLIHYMEVRQQIAGIKSAMLFDEIDHLGAYISNNRFDMTLRDALGSADALAVGSYSEVVDRYFEGEDWQKKPIPAQDFHPALVRILNVLDRLRPNGWLMMDSFVRNFDGDTRRSIGETIVQLEGTLRSHARRRFQIGSAPPLQIWMCRHGAPPSPAEMKFQAEVGCLVGSAMEIMVLILTYSRPGEIVEISCARYGAPTVIQKNYGDLQKEAERQKKRVTSLSVLANNKHKK